MIDKSKARWTAACLLLLIWSVAGTLVYAAAQEDVAGPSQSPVLESTGPFEAYRAGQYDVAVDGFRERVERKPDDPVRQLNLGSALHQTAEYAEAESALQRALDARDRGVKAAALYNLGNNAYHQGRLEDAVEHYKAALDLQPEDEDTKYNLEFVQQEIERRREQAQNRQQSPQDDQSEGQDQEDAESNEDQQSQDQQSSQSGNEGERNEADSGESQDSDGDGLSDEQERNADNPTDPNNPDSDGDGRSDGEEDRNGNGRLDEGETNPNVPDQPESTGQGEEQGQNPDQREAVGQAGRMSPEDAARLLASLEDRRPPGARGKKVAETAKRSEKDW